MGIQQVPPPSTGPTLNEITTAGNSAGWGSTDVSAGAVTSISNSVVSAGTAAGFSSIDQNSLSFTIPNSSSYYHFRVNLNAGTYSISCNSGVVTEVNFIKNGVHVPATTSSGSATAVVPGGADFVVVKINTGTNVVVTIRQTSTVTSGSTATITATTVTSTAAYNTTGLHFYYLIGGGGAGGGPQGGAGHGGAGGGSGYLQTGYAQINAPITITVGAGGAGPQNAAGVPGNPTFFMTSDGKTVSALGGSTSNTQTGGVGGSPGGSGGNAGGGNGSAGTVNNAAWDTRYYNPTRSAGGGGSTTPGYPVNAGGAGGTFGGGGGGAGSWSGSFGSAVGGGGGGLSPGGSGNNPQVGGGGGAYMVKLEI